MKTKIVRVDKENPDKEILQKVGETIKKGGLVCISHRNRVRTGRRWLKCRFLTENLSEQRADPLTIR